MLAAGLAPAQDQPDPGEREQQEPTYEGPSILGRDDSSWLESRGPFRAFGLYAQIIGVYDSGLVAPTNAQTKPAPAPAYGEEVNFGANASRRWRRGKFNVDYQGSFRHYTNAPAFDGLDQFLQIGFSEAISRHLRLDLKDTLGTTALANGAFSYLPVAAFESFGLPTNELLDNRTNYVQSRADLTWQVTSRLSIDFGGDGFVVRRESLLLAGLNGYDARASVAYRVSRHQTISALYDDIAFDFQRTFGDSRLEIAALGYSADLGRDWDVAVLMGGARIGTLGLSQVSLDPAIAALLGQSFATVTFQNLEYLPIGEARLTRRFRRASITFDYAKSITPGNGLYLTSRQSSGSFLYSYTATRTLQARANAGYNQLSALGQTLGSVTNFQGGVQVLYKIGGAVFADLRYDYRRYTSGETILQLDSSRISAGIAFSMGEHSPVAW